MLNIVLTYATGIGWALSLLASTLTVVIFQITFGFSSLIAVPVGVLAFVTTFVIWIRFINLLGYQEPPGRGH